jgi:uncharacterized protein (TIGR02996 family)
MNQDVFLRAIEAEPLNEAMRGVYADWLDENDQPEEAQRQREWVKAFHYLAQFTREHYDGWEYDDDGERIPGTLKYDFAKVMDEVGWWKESVTEGTAYIQKGSIGFSTVYAQDELHDPEKRREFWRCFKVITGVEASEELRNQEWYRCAC